MVFDFDGTLVQSNSLKIKTLFTVIADIGPYGDLIDTILKQNLGDRTVIFTTFVEHLAKKGLLPEQHTSASLIKELVHRYSVTVEAGIAAAPEVPGAGACLKMLQERGCALFINSATPEEPLRRVLEKRGMTHFFKGIFGGHHEKVNNLKRAAAQMGVPLDRLIFVGDNEVDWQASRVAGCRFIGVLFDGDIKESNDYKVVRDLRDLGGLL